MTLPGFITDRRTGISYPVNDYQREALAHLEANPRAALFLGMSLAKTMITLTYLHEMIYREAAFTRVLVIAPGKVARVTWPDELEKWEHLAGMRWQLVDGGPSDRREALQTPAEVFLISVDNLVSLIEENRAKTRGLPFDCVVIDELTLFKSRSSKRFKALRAAIRNVPYRVGLTGTPSPNGYIDLWSQMALLDDGERLERTFGAFVGKYFTVRGNGMIVYEYRPRPGAVNAISARVADIALTMRAADHVKLPPARYVDEEVDLSPGEVGAYEGLERDFVLSLGGEPVTANGAAALVNKLLQVTSGAVYDDAGAWRPVGRSKLDKLRTIARACEGEPLLVVYQFRHEVERVKEEFPGARELGKGARVAGDVREWNEGKIPLLLVHPASAGHGLNLQFGGRRIVWLSSTWNLEQYLQTNARLVRRGQEQEVFIHRVVARGTVDTRVLDRLLNKHNNQEFLFNEINVIRSKYGV